MSDNLMDKVSAFGERLKIGDVEVGTSEIIEDATSENLDEPDCLIFVT